jgi:hypothetical protein
MTSTPSVSRDTPLRSTAVLLALAALALALLLPAAPARAASTIRYAAPDGATTGACDGNWANACTLAYALSVAQSGDQIWVKAGVHTPGPQPQ